MWPGDNGRKKLVKTYHFSNSRLLKGGYILAMFEVILTSFLVCVCVRTSGCTAWTFAADMG
jgi:hypothetical protein